jgi:hypothetical protein
VKQLSHKSRDAFVQFLAQFGRLRTVANGERCAVIPFGKRFFTTEAQRHRGQIESISVCHFHVLLSGEQAEVL